MAKKGQKMAVFWPSRAEICENQKKAWTFSYFYPREAVYQISENLAHQTWRKCVANGRTDGRTDGTEIIGPSGKIPGTNKKIPLSEKIFMSKKLQKWPKKGQKWSWRGEF